jgi:hypothetical protein
MQTPPTPRGGGAGLTQCFQNPAFYDEVVHLLDDVDQHRPPSGAQPSVPSSPSPPSPIAPPGDRLNTSNPCDESFDPLETDAAAVDDTSVDATLEISRDHPLEQRYQRQQQQQMSREVRNRSELYEAISQSFFHPNERDFGSRVMQLEQCISSSQHIDLVPTHEVLYLFIYLLINLKNNLQICICRCSAN